MSDAAAESVKGAKRKDDRPKRLSVADARARILAAVEPVRAIERVAVRAALGRVLAADAISPLDVPAHTNSAVDGYAVAADSLARQGTVQFRVVGTAWAGRPYVGTAKAGECVHIMTGAPMPSGTDTVVAEENTQRQGETVSIECDRHDARNVREAGEDFTKGQVALRRGKRIMAAELGILASLGFVEVSVFRRPRVAFFSTGDELRSLGEPLEHGQVYDSNRYTLFGLLRQMDVELLDLGVVRDQRAAVERAFTQAADSADVVVTSGGVSVGAADYVKDVVSALGRIEFWLVAMRPGRPLVFGRIGNAAFFGLPGNPVAVMVTFYQFVRPAVERLMGQTDPALPLTLRARTRSPLKTRLGRTEFIRGVLERDEHGDFVVTSTGNQGSGILSSMSSGNCFIVLPPECGNTEPGAVVDVQPFFGVS